MNTLQYAVLGILSYAPFTGYQLKKIFDKSINNFWHASLSQIYKELSTLEKNGQVTSTIQEQGDRPDKRVYEITADGRKTFDDWLAHFPTKYNAPKRDEFSLRIFFGGRLQKTELKRQFERFIEEHKQFEQDLNENKKKIEEIVHSIQLSTEHENIGMFFIQRRAHLVNQTLIEWAEECLRELDGLE